MAKTRAWVLTAVFLGLGLAGVLALYLGTDCAYNTERPHCGPVEEVLATVFGFGGFAFLLIGVVFLIRAIILELRLPRDGPSTDS